MLSSAAVVFAEDGVRDTIISGSLFAALGLAFLAGIVSFLSPCVLPLAPGYLSYMTGLTGTEIGNPEGGVKTRSRVLLGSILFVLGFSVVFVLYGVAFGAAGSFLLQWREPLMRVMGVLVIVLGLSFMGALPGLPGVNRDMRFHMTPKYALWGAPMLGVLFGLGWSPCVGPTLAAVESLAFSEGSAWRGAALAFAYCLGLGLPFIILGLAFRYSMGAIGWVKRHYTLIMRIGGGLLIVIGVLLVLGGWDDVNTWMRTVVPGGVWKL